ncbi:DUF397 domain-containing protein [Streptomyces sp. NBC_01622]|uniref:DUF397 domain-containing protein n=1 Tax=Streptomyces sp. NBC_01622 TaxID=2975903 RepID=UPI00386F2FDA|nr:DUF397 domain-containing protein [Streptomyces sp. NBC_01622]
MSSPLHWQKSSFSGGGSGEDCLEIAADPTTLHLRESDHPTTVLAPTPTALHALLRTCRSGGGAGWNGLRGA